MNVSNHPRIVCLCGSTRFRDEYDAANRTFTLEGKIVLTCGVWIHHEAEKANAPEIKARLDRLHEAKIDLADFVFVINPGGYVGDSTRREIEYALNEDKPVKWLEPMPGTQGCCERCLYVGYVDMGGVHARRGFVAKGWKNVPRRKDGSGGYWLCPECAGESRKEEARS